MTFVDINEILSSENSVERVKKGKQLAENELTIGACFALIDGLIRAREFTDAIEIAQHLWKTRGYEKDLTKFATAVYRSRDLAKLEEVTALIENYMKDHSASPQLIHRLVVNYRPLGKDAEAIKILEKAYEDGAFLRYPHLTTDYGDILNRAGRQNEFVDFFRQLPDPLKNNDRAKKEYVLSLISNSELQEAEAVLDTCSKDNIYRNRLSELNKMKEQSGFRSFSEDLALQRIPEHILPFVKKIKQDYQAASKICFIVMKFQTTKLHSVILESIRETLSQYNISALRADDKDYADDLNTNILAHMYSCDFALAVFERLSEDDFNPNVSYEVGYLRGMHKDVCFLKDKTLKYLHTDLVGQLYKNFDPQDPKTTIPPQLTKWLLDKGLIAS